MGRPFSMRPLFYAGVASLATLVFAACGGGSTGSPQVGGASPTPGQTPSTTVVPPSSTGTAAPVPLPAATTAAGQAITGTIIIPPAAAGSSPVPLAVTVTAAVPPGIPALAAARSSASRERQSLPNGAQPLLFIVLTTSSTAQLQAPPDFSFTFAGASSQSQYFFAKFDSTPNIWNYDYYIGTLNGSGAIVDQSPGGTFTITPNEKIVFALYSIPRVATISQTHILTADYFGPIDASAGLSGSVTVTPQQAAPSLTWAETPPSTQAATDAAGIKTLYYTNPIRQAAGSPIYLASDAAVDCSGNPIRDASNSTLLVQQPSAALGALWTQYVNGVFAQNKYDAVFADDAGPVVAGSTSAAICNYTDATWDTAAAAMETQLGLPVIQNSLSDFQQINGVWQPSPALSSNLTTTSIGAMEEQCYSSDSNASVIALSGSLWLAAETSELSYSAISPKLFICYPRNTTTASSAQGIALRNYVLASFLLTYNPASSILWDIFSTPSSYHVEPESTLVALNPASSPASIGSLAIGTSNVYAQEYLSCYIGGSFVGACAAIVNSDTAAHAYPFGAKYGHALTLTGGGIKDGGTVATTGSVPTSLPATTGVIVFQ